MQKTSKNDLIKGLFSKLPGCVIFAGFCNMLKVDYSATVINFDF